MGSEVYEVSLPGDPPGTVRRRGRRPITATSQWQWPPPEEWTLYWLPAPSGVRDRTTQDKVIDVHVSVKWLRNRDGDNCHYCGGLMNFEVRNGPTGAHLEHKVPISRGGEHSEGNCVLACRTCNLKKHDRTAEEFLSTMEEVA